MGKIMISENQYNKIKNLLIENAINEQNLDGSLNVEKKTAYKIDPVKLTFINNDVIEVDVEQGGSNIKVMGGANFKPTIKGNLEATAQVQDVNTNVTKSNKVIFICNNEKISVDNKYYNIKNRGRNPVLPGLREFCKIVKEKTKKSYGVESVSGKGGSLVYKQENDRNVKSKDGKLFKIPANTGYVARPEKKGASFKIGPNNFGWFSCTNNQFVIGGKNYYDEDKGLVNKLVKTLCKTTGEVVTDKPIIGGGGSGGSRLASSSSELIADFQNYI